MENNCCFKLITKQALYQHTSLLSCLISKLLLLYLISEYSFRADYRILTVYFSDYFCRCSVIVINFFTIFSLFTNQFKLIFLSICIIITKTLLKPFLNYYNSLSYLYSLNLSTFCLPWLLIKSTILLNTKSKLLSTKKPRFH